MMDEYQKRYTAHQQRKKEVLSKLTRERHSSRVFGKEQVDGTVISELIADCNCCPSSCDRKAISVQAECDRDIKALLGGVLVGGVGWIHRASCILLIFADPIAYKAGDEINFMPYLDAGCVIQQLYLSATSHDLKCCYVNPNVREFNVGHFKNIFGDKIFCGAFAVGLPPLGEGKL